MDTGKSKGLALALLGLVGALGACHAQASGTAAPAGSASNPSGSRSPASAPPSAGQGGNAQSGGGEIAECKKAQLSVAVDAGDAGASHLGVVVTFSNTGTGPCRIVGYPGVAALDANRAQVAQASRTLAGYLGGVRAGSRPPVVDLLPGQVASAMVEAAAGPNGCPPYAGFLVTAPDDTASTVVPHAFDRCEDLQVHPVVPGTSGRSG